MARLGYQGMGISAFCADTGTPLSAFNGYRIECEECIRSFRSFQWASYMAANPGWWLLTRAERRARARAPREAARLAKWGPRRPLRQGSPPRPLVVVPPEYIWPPRPSVLPIADSRYILTHGKRAFRAMERRRALTPELIAATIEQDAKLRWSSDV